MRTKKSCRRSLEFGTPVECPSVCACHGLEKGVFGALAGRFGSIYESLPVVSKDLFGSGRGPAGGETVGPVPRFRESRLGSRQG